jgi:hypothetical protein
VVQTPVFVPVVQTPVFVPVEATLPELPRDLQNPVVVSPVVRLFSLSVSVPLVQARELVPEPWDALSELEGPRP